MRFIFWNQNRKSLSKYASAIARVNRADVLLLVECGSDPIELALRLSEETGRPWRQHPSPVQESGGLRVLSVLGDGAFREVHADLRGRLSVRVFQHGRFEFVLALLHMSSKLHASDSSQFVEAIEMVDAISTIEQERRHQRTIIVGDLNMNPFESPMVATRGFNAVSTRHRAAKLSRTVQGKAYPFLYNPMWGLFGDNTPGPPGTYYRAVSAHAEIDWNVYDQVLIRPDVLGHFGRDVQVLSMAGEQSLTTRHGAPDHRNASDHLPILFSIE